MRYAYTVTIGMNELEWNKWNTVGGVIMSEEVFWNRGRLENETRDSKVQIPINGCVLYLWHAHAQKRKLSRKKKLSRLVANLDPRTLLLTEGEMSSGNPETKCLLIGFWEEQSKASLIDTFMLARGVSRRRKVQIANFWLWKPLTAHVPLHRVSQTLGSLRGSGDENGLVAWPDLSYPNATRSCLNDERRKNSNSIIIL